MVPAKNYYTLGKIIVHDYLFRSFCHGLRTKGFVILAGKSGTGKTKIFEEFFFAEKNFYYLIDSFKNFFDIFNHFFQMIDNYDQIDDFDKYYDFWKKALDQWTNVWEKTKVEQTINIISLLTNYNYSKTQLNSISDDKYKSLLKISYIAVNQFNFNITDFMILRRTRKKGKYAFYVNKTVDDTTSSAPNDDSPQIKHFNKNKLFPILREIFEDLRTIKEHVQNPNQTTLSTKHIVNEALDFFKLVFKFEYFLNMCDIPKSNLIRKKIIPIRVNFTDSKSLIGYYNPLANTYEKTELLDFIIEAIADYTKNQDNASLYFVLFDEMNLARVEYYFADFLSAMESKQIEDISEVTQDMLQEIQKINPNSQNKSLIGFHKIPILLHKNFQISDPPQKIYLPPNLYIVGTVNIDETTHMFSPKVLDRAFVVEFDSDIEKYVENLKAVQKPKKPLICIHEFARNGKFHKIDINEIRDFIKSNENTVENTVDLIIKISKILKPYELDFGHRVFNEMIMFIKNYQKLKYLDESNNTIQSEQFSDNEALDLAIKMKILPKFHGTKSKLENPLRELLKELLDQNSQAIAGSLRIIKLPTEVKEQTEGQTQQNLYKILVKDPNGNIDLYTKYPHSVLKILQMLYRLNVHGYASFM